jgi:flagellar biosynthesis component FlhA
MSDVSFNVKITQDMIDQAINRQVRVALAQLVETKEINDMIKKAAKEYFPIIIDKAINDVTPDEVKKMFLEKLQSALDKKVSIRLKGL